MELDLEQFFRNLLEEYGVRMAFMSADEFEELVKKLAEHARDFRNMP